MNSSSSISQLYLFIMKLRNYPKFILNKYQDWFYFIHLHDIVFLDNHEINLRLIK